jgi:hypothetical protein
MAITITIEPHGGRVLMGRLEELCAELPDRADEIRKAATLSLGDRNGERPADPRARFRTFTGPALVPHDYLIGATAESYEWWRIYGDEPVFILAEDCY